MFKIGDIIINKNNSICKIIGTTPYINTDRPYILYYNLQVIISKEPNFTTNGTIFSITKPEATEFWKKLDNDSVIKVLYGDGIKI